MKKETPHIASSQEQDKSSLKESVEGIKIAEIAADARIEVEKEIFLTDLPRGQWFEYVNTYITKHPELEEYRAFFEEAIEVITQRNIYVDAAWQIAVNSSGKKEALGQKTLSGKPAQALFEMRTGVVAQDPISAKRFKTCIMFDISDEDFKQLVFQRDPSFQIERGNFRVGGVAIDAEIEHTYPYIVMPLDPLRTETTDEIDAWELKWERAEGEVHETEHIKTALLRVAKRSAIAWPSFTQGIHIRERLRKWKLEDGPTNKARVVEMAKDEMLSYFSAVHLIEASYNKANKKNLDPDTLKFTEDALTYNQKRLLKEEGHYRPEARKLGAEELYVRMIKKGVTAFKTILDLYREEGHGSLSARRAINLLEQFPAKKWPAVARLVEMRHNKNK